MEIIIPVIFRFIITHHMFNSSKLHCTFQEYLDEYKDIYEWLMYCFEIPFLCTINVFFMSNCRSTFRLLKYQTEAN